MTGTFSLSPEVVASLGTSEAPKLTGMLVRVLVAMEGQGGVGGLNSSVEVSH